MFMHIFFHRLKVILKTKSLIFWTLIFPIILATLFNMAFSNLSEEESFKVIDIAIVNDSSYQNEINFKKVIDSVSVESKNQIFNVVYVNSEKAAKEKLEKNDITGYYIIKDKINITVKDNNLSSTIMKQVVDNYYQTTAIISSIYQFNSEVFVDELINDLNNNYNYFTDISNDKVDTTVVYFYTLIGMVCLYAGYFGLDAVKETEANLSKRAARITVAPTHKFKTLFSSLLAGFVIQFIEILILLAYLILILKIDFGNQFSYILLLVFFGNLAGITLGILIGVCNRKSENVKVALLLSITMAFSFLSGMMGPQIKYLISRHIPLLGMINPVSMITDALYSLYYYDNLSKYTFNIVSLSIFSLVMIILSYLFIRRKKYDSI